MRTRLPVQGTQVLSTAWEDSTCFGQQKPMSHTTTECRVPRACFLKKEEPLQLEVCAPQQTVAPMQLQLERAHTQQQRPRANKFQNNNNNIINVQRKLKRYKGQRNERCITRKLQDWVPRPVSDSLCCVISILLIA